MGWPQSFTYRTPSGEERTIEVHSEEELLRTYEHLRFAQSVARGSSSETVDALHDRGEFFHNVSQQAQAQKLQMQGHYQESNADAGLAQMGGAAKIVSSAADLTVSAMGAGAGPGDPRWFVDKGYGLVTGGIDAKASFDQGDTAGAAAKTLNAVNVFDHAAPKAISAGVNLGQGNYVDAAGDAVKAAGNAMQSGPMQSAGDQINAGKKMFDGARDIVDGSRIKSANQSEEEDMVPRIDAATRRFDAHSQHAHGLGNLVATGSNPATEELIRKMEREHPEIAAKARTNEIEENAQRYRNQVDAELKRPQSGAVEQRQPESAPGVDWDFIGEREGKAIDEAYVPKNKKTGEIIGQSGVTIGTGFDLGQHSRADLEKMGIPENVIRELDPYLGKKRMEADAYVNAHPLKLTPEQVREIDEKVQHTKQQQIEDAYNRDRAPGMPEFDDLTSAQQTVLTSVGFQYGDLSERTPKFWKQVTEGDWDGAIDNLNDFKDQHKPRRQLEADLLEKDRSAHPDAYDGTSGSTDNSPSGAQLEGAGSGFGADGLSELLAEAERMAGEIERAADEVQQDSDAADASSQRADQEGQAAERASERSLREADEAEQASARADKEATEAEAASTRADKEAGESEAASARAEKEAGEAQASSARADKEAAEAEAASAKADKEATEAEAASARADKEASKAEASSAKADKEATEAEAASTRAEKEAQETEAHLIRVRQYKAAIERLNAKADQLVAQIEQLRQHAEHARTAAQDAQHAAEDARADATGARSDSDHKNQDSTQAATDSQRTEDQARTQAVEAQQKAEAAQHSLEVTAEALRRARSMM